MNNGLTLLLRIFLLACTLYFAVLFFTSMEVIYDRARIDWRQAAANVLASGVEARRGDRGESYCPWISFSYEVALVRYEQRANHRRGKCFSDEGRAARVAALYPPGKQITVFYREHSPGDATLYTGLGWTTYFGAAISLLVCLACGLLLYLTRFGRGRGG